MRRKSYNQARSKMACPRGPCLIQGTSRPGLQIHTAQPVFLPPVMPGHHVQHSSL